MSPPRALSFLMGLFVSALLVAAFCVIATVGCSRSVSSPRPPLPPFIVVDGLEPDLAHHLQDRYRQVEQNRESAEAWGRLAAALHVNGLVADSAPFYEGAAALDPDDFRWPYFRGVVASVGDHGRALTWFEKATRANPEYAPALTYLGRAQLSLGDAEAAQESFRGALELEPRTARAWIGLAKIALERGAVDEAWKHLEQAKDCRASSLEFHGLRAEVRRRQGHAEAAAESLREGAGTLRWEPLPDRAWQELGLREGVTLHWKQKRCDGALREGRVEEALGEWRLWVEADPRSSEAHRHLGTTLARAGRQEEAVSTLETAVSLGPENAAAHSELGTALAAAGDVEGAIAEWREALRCDPDLHGAMANLGGALCSRGEVEMGLPLLETAAAALPDRWEVQLNLAANLARHDRIGEAILVLERAVARDPTELRSQFELGVLLARAGRFAEAADAFGEVTRRDPGRRSAHRNRIRALRGARLYANAIVALEEALHAFPDDPAFQLGLAFLLVVAPQEALRDPGRARSLIDPLVSDSAPVDVSRTLAAIQAESGDFEGAAATLERALERQLPPETRSRLQGLRASVLRGEPIRLPTPGEAP